MTKIEQVARAIAFVEGSRIVGPGQCRATREFAWQSDGRHFEQYADAHWREHVTAAELAIQAMREPSDAMLARGDVEIATNYSALVVWETMIDAALDEEKESAAAIEVSPRTRCRRPPALQNPTR